jgi:hypothetical protein
MARIKWIAWFYAKPTDPWLERCDWCDLLIVGLFVMSNRRVGVPIPETIDPPAPLSLDVAAERLLFPTGP